jgi:DNA-binding XRE family transcriptional regulator
MTDDAAYSLARAILALADAIDRATERRARPARATALRDVRRARNMTQREAANLLGVSQTMVSMLESGERTPNAALQAQILERFGAGS